MGIIQKQAIQGTIYSYLGVGVGFITTLLLYPNVFSTEQLGVIRLLVSYSALFAQFATLGFPRVITMMFTYFRDYERRHKGFFHITILVSLAGLLTTLIIFFSIEPLIKGEGKEKSALFAEYIYYIIPLIIATLFYIIFDNYYKVLFNAVQGTFLKEFLQRLIILISTLLYLFNLIDFDLFIILFVIAFMAPPIILMVLLMIDKQLSLKPDYGYLNKSLISRMINVSFFGILASFSGILVLNIDSIMIKEYLDLGSTGIYSITFFFGTVVLLPSRPLLKISSVVIADAWKDGDIDTINKVYFKSCLTQIIIGSLIFVGIWGNIHNVFGNLLPMKYEEGKYVIFFISLTSLIQMAGGTSNMILFTSKKYKVHTYFMIILVVLLVVTNMILIPAMGIVGAAIASAGSFLVFNIIKYIYLRNKFGFKPYDYRIAIVVLFAASVYGINLLLPKFDSFILDILYRSFIMTIIYVFLILISKVSEDVNSIFDHILQKIKLK